MAAEDDYEIYRREQLTQVRDIRVTEQGIQSFEKGLVRIVLRSEGGVQELKVNERELKALHRAAGERITKKILPGQIQELKAAIPTAQGRTEEVAADPMSDRMDLQDAVADEMKAWQQYAAALEVIVEHIQAYGTAEPTQAATQNDLIDAELVKDHEHNPVQHRDGKPPWCPVCRLDAKGHVPKSRFEKDRPTVVIRDSAGVPVFEIETQDFPENAWEPTPEQDAKETLAVAQDLLRGYGHDAVADAIADYQPVMKVAGPLSEAVSRMVPKYEAQPTEFLTNYLVHKDGSVETIIEPLTEIETTPISLDPKPWKCTSCGDRFVRYQQEPTSHVTKFLPRPEHEQSQMAYPNALDPEPWRWGTQRFEDADPAGQDFDFSPEFAPRPQYVQEKGYYA